MRIYVFRLPRWLAGLLLRLTEFPETLYEMRVVEGEIR